uniref:Sodium potassium-transporting atpase subunit alpha isoform x1 n=1 Tax=Triatoma infestans TaxID=30076 RepID=A0A161MAF9_TRIIF
MSADAHGRTDSYRVATVAAINDDNRTADGKAKSRRKPPVKKAKEKEI